MSRGNGKCILKFQNEDAYYQYATSSAYTEPFVGAYPKDGVTLEDAEVKYNLTEEEKSLITPLTFEITSPGEIKWYCANENDTYAKTIEYKKNDGEWTEITAGRDADVSTAITTTIGLYYYVGYDEETGRYVWSGNNGTIYTNDSNIYISTGSEIYINVQSVEQSGSAITTDYGTFYYIGYIEDPYYAHAWSGVNGTVYCWYPPEDIHPDYSVYAYVTELHQQHLSTPSISVVSGDTVQFRGDNVSYYESYEASTFYGTTCGFVLKGNIMSLINSTDFFSTLTLSGESNFNKLFSNCTGLTDASKLALPATSLTPSCYSVMFSGCTSLTSAPSLPATTLAQGCYNGMFERCTSLITAPELPATTLLGSCYGSMFSGCTSLTSAPSLPATTLAQYCCQYMFAGCTNLTSAPSLPATTLANYCYQYMFAGCVNLTTAPELPATTLVNYCYESMFSGCTSLNYVKCLATTLGATANTRNWMAGVNTTGTFVASDSENSAGWSIGVHGIPTKWFLSGVPLNYLTFEILEDGTVWFLKQGLSSFYIEYTKDNGETWGRLTESTSSFNATTGDIVKFRGTVRATDANTSYIYVSATCSYNVGGDVRSLSDFNLHSIISGLSCEYARLFRNTKVVDASNLLLKASRLYTGCYYGMFSGCTSLTSAPSIQATTLANSACSSMFMGCTSLTTAPSLTATTLAVRCYENMFAGCTSLTTAPSLPATTLAQSCYSNMFGGCTSLTSTPSLTATTLAQSCYSSMFSGCTSLTSAPSLPATTLAPYCYRGMFAGCTGLTAAPSLPATALTYYCYHNMFSGCTSLTSAPSLPATNLTNAYNCYDGMFAGCTSLTTAPELPATTLAASCYQGMFSGCTSLTTGPSTIGTTATTISTNKTCACMFADCAALTSAPALPATISYGSACYSGMFASCTALQVAPALPSLSAYTSAYTAMFKGCTSLTTPPVLPATMPGAWAYHQMFYGCTSLVTAPDLLAVSADSRAYTYMFAGCTSLNYVKCLLRVLSNWDGSLTVASFLDGVQTNGTLVKNPNTPTSDWEGVRVVPNTWTIVDAT